MIETCTYNAKYRAKYNKQQKDRWSYSFLGLTPEKQQSSVKKHDLLCLGLCVDLQFCFCAYLLVFVPLCCTTCSDLACSWVWLGSKQIILSSLECVFLVGGSVADNRALEGRGGRAEGNKKVELGKNEVADMILIIFPSYVIVISVNEPH